MGTAALIGAGICATGYIGIKIYEINKKSGLAKIPIPSLGTPALTWQFQDVDGSSALDGDQVGTGWIPRNIKGNSNKGVKKNNNKKPDYLALVATAAIITTANQIVRTIDIGMGKLELSMKTAHTDYLMQIVSPMRWLTLLNELIMDTNIFHKKMNWKEIVKSTKNRPAKYCPNVDIESLERMIWEKGTPVTNGKTWKVMEFD